jgi:hypothetical protein
MRAGYHLIGYRDETDAETQERHRCEDAVYALALERLNTAHGTQYVAEDFERFCQPDDASCAGQYEGELARLQNEARIELECRDGDLVLSRVAHPEDERITVKIGPDVEPLN